LSRFPAALAITLAILPVIKEIVPMVKNCAKPTVFPLNKLNQKFYLSIISLSRFPAAAALAITLAILPVIKEIVPMVKNCAKPTVFPLNKLNQKLAKSIKLNRAISCFFRK